MTCFGDKQPAPPVVRVLDATRHAAERYGHDYIGTEHLLLGLLSQSQTASRRRSWRS